MTEISNENDNQRVYLRDGVERGRRRALVNPSRWVEEQDQLQGREDKNGKMSWSKETANKMWKRVRRHREERATRGYSTYDWWNFDQYIAGVVANACQDFRTKGVGRPIDMEDEEWMTFLLSIEEPLRAWADDKLSTYDKETSQKLYDDAKAAWHRFADRFSQFWD